MASSPFLTSLTTPEQIAQKKAHGKIRQWAFEISKAAQQEAEEKHRSRSFQTVNRILERMIAEEQAGSHERAEGLNRLMRADLFLDSLLSLSPEARDEWIAETGGTW